MAVKVNIQTYNGMNTEQREIQLPQVSAVYVWRFDFNALLNQGPTQIREALRRFFGHQGRRIRPIGDPFLSMEWRARREPMKPDRLDSVVNDLALATPNGKALADLATSLQRPVYVGVSTQLGSRIEAHLSGDTRLRDDIRPLELSDCAVEWTPIEVTQFAASIEEGDLLPNELTHIESLLIRTSTPFLNERMDS